MASKIDKIEEKVDFYIETLCQLIDFKEFTDLVQNSVKEALEQFRDEVPPDIIPDLYDEQAARTIFIANFAVRFAIMNNVGPTTLTSAFQGAMRVGYTQDVIKRFTRLMEGKKPSEVDSNPLDDYKS